MAEVIGLAASIIQIGATGLKLSETLYQYAETVASADKRVGDIALEVNLTSSLIKELGTIFNEKRNVSLLSQDAVKTANTTIKACENVFVKMSAEVNKTNKNKLGKFTLPFREPKINLLRTHLDMLKNTLQLLLGVLNLAHSKLTHDDRRVEQKLREQIKTLLLEKKKSTKRYEESLKNYNSDSEDDEWEEQPSHKPSLDSPKDGTISISQISTTITTDNLAQCVQHVQTLLGDIERLQQVLAKAEAGVDHSEHHQAIIGSYLRTKDHLDGIFLGNPKSAGDIAVDQIETLSKDPKNESATSLKQSLTGSTIRGTTPRNSEDGSVLSFQSRMSEAEFKVAIQGAIEEGKRQERERLSEETKYSQQKEPTAVEAARNDDFQRGSDISFPQDGKPTTTKGSGKIPNDADVMDSRTGPSISEEAMRTIPQSSQTPSLEGVPSIEDQKANKNSDEIIFLDALGRKFRFPFELVNEFDKLKALIDKIFATNDKLKLEVNLGRFDLLGSGQRVITFATYDREVQPGRMIVMSLWSAPIRTDSSTASEGVPNRRPRSKLHVLKGRHPGMRLEVVEALSDDESTNSTPAPYTQAPPPLPPPAMSVHMRPSMSMHTPPTISMEHVNVYNRASPSHYYSARYPARQSTHSDYSLPVTLQSRATSFQPFSAPKPSPDSIYRTERMDNEKKKEVPHKSSLPSANELQSKASERGRYSSSFRARRLERQKEQLSDDTDKHSHGQQKGTIPPDLSNTTGYEIPPRSTVLNTSDRPSYTERQRSPIPSRFATYPSARYAEQPQSAVNPSDDTETDHTDSSDTYIQRRSKKRNQTDPAGSDEDAWETIETETETETETANSEKDHTPRLVKRRPTIESDVEQTRQASAYERRILARRNEINLSRTVKSLSLENQEDEIKAEDSAKEDRQWRVIVENSKSARRETRLRVDPNDSMLARLGIEHENKVDEEKVAVEVPALRTMVESLDSEDDEDEPPYTSKERSELQTSDTEVDEEVDALLRDWTTVV